MSTYEFANNASTTLGSALSNSATTVTVASGTGAEFPSPGAGQWFMATLWASGSTTGTPNEIVKVTSRTGDTLTVVRAQEGTTAQAWSVGDTVANYITAGFLNQLVDAGALQLQAGNYAVDTGTANAGAIVLVPTVASYATIVGVPIRVKKMNQTNTGSFTLNVNNLGPIIVDVGNAPLEGGEFPGNSIFEVVYNGTFFDALSPPGLIHTNLLAGDSVTNAILAEVPALTVKGNLTNAEGQPYDVDLDDLAAALGLTNSAYNDRVVAGVDVVTAPAWAHAANVIIVGAGGSGQGGSAPVSGFPNGYTGGGGGGGGVALAKVPITPGASYTRTVGAGGAQAAAATKGNTGGTSSLTGIGQATGGQGAGSTAPVLQAGGYGGVGSAYGSIYLRTFTGGDGNDGQQANINVSGGSGAPGYLGMGQGRSGDGQGQPGVSPGAGGGGGYGGSFPSGKGADGAVYIEWLAR